MPDALGEFGLNPLAVVKQEILEQLRAAQGPLTMGDMISLFHRDARSRDIIDVVNELVQSRQVIVSKTKKNETLVSAVHSRGDTESDMLELLAEK